MLKVMYEWECPSCDASILLLCSKKAKEFMAKHHKQSHPESLRYDNITFKVYYGNVDITDEFSDAAIDTFPYHDGLIEAAEEELLGEGWRMPL